MISFIGFIGSTLLAAGMSAEKNSPQKSPVDRERLLEFVICRALAYSYSQISVQEAWQIERQNPEVEPLWSLVEKSSTIPGGARAIFEMALEKSRENGGFERMIGFVQKMDRENSLQSYGVDLPLAYPLPSKVSLSSRWGNRIDPNDPQRKRVKFHDGIDLPVPPGTPVLASESGVVVYESTTGNCGWGYTIEHPNGLRTTYCHLSRKDLGSKKEVSRGEQIGLSGGKRGAQGAGNSQGPHLHYSVKELKNGEWKSVDPLKYLADPGEKGREAQEVTPPEEAPPEGWMEWLSSFVWPEENKSKEASEDLELAWFEPMSGLDARLENKNGESWTEGGVPAGTYMLIVPGHQSEFVLEAGKKYQASRAGGLFEIR